MYLVESVVSTIAYQLAIHKIRLHKSNSKVFQHGQRKQRKRQGNSAPFASCVINNMFCSKQNKCGTNEHWRASLDRVKIIFDYFLRPYICQISLLDLRAILWTNLKKIVWRSLYYWHFWLVCYWFVWFDWLVKSPIFVQNVLGDSTKRSKRLASVPGVLPD